MLGVVDGTPVEVITQKVLLELLEVATTFLNAPSIELLPATTAPKEPEPT
jgi:hypothetical protein